MFVDKNFREFREWSSNRENYFSRNSPVHSAAIIIHIAPRPFPLMPFFAAQDSHTCSVVRCFASVLVFSIHSLQAYCSVQYSFDSFPAKPLASCLYVELYLRGYADSFNKSTSSIVALPQRTRKYSQNQMGPWRL